MFVAGIDPGIKGAVVVLNLRREIVEMVAFDDKTEREIAAIFKDISKRFQPITVFKELFASYGVDGRVSFVVGRQHGILDFTLEALGMARVDVRAAQWQKEIHQASPGLKPKYLSQLAGEELFADADFRRVGKRGKKTSKIHDGLIDAALIATYGLRYLQREMNSKN